MKVAFHFDAFHQTLKANYGDEIESLLFKTLLSYPNLSISSKVSTGDLLLHNKMEEANLDRLQIINLWLRPNNAIWSTMMNERLMHAIESEIFAVCFETIEVDFVDILDKNLWQVSEAYLGAIEVEDTSQLHWIMYSNPPRYRVINKNASVFWDGISEESKDESTINRLA